MEGGRSKEIKKTKKRENGRRDYVAGLSVNTTHFELVVRAGRYSRRRRDRSITQKVSGEKERRRED